MSPATKKKDTPTNKNQEAIDILEARLEEMGDLSITLPVALEVVNLTETIKKLKQSPSVALF